ncbi:tetratricopeptide repeat protein [Novispirillum itersonii]|uniref:Tetratricopeptide (TPR) repeat protein n=1 Tax=Novispirillum itersonii TaxID=189 RepID=A0A7W9ZK40_NOVIT|nr:tetratricopeptide repeat protein [Novispirillum itersonii]MBB6211709.1 tetratricopeptide (TPR) repeat protein [Novispirillum itersonii]
MADVVAGSITVQNVVAFGNITVSTGNCPAPTPLRLDWYSPEQVMVEGQPDLFAALQWRYRMAPAFIGREPELQALLEWARGGGNTLSVRLLSGGGGSGKTRLAAEAAKSLRAGGWSAGFVPRTATTQTTQTIHSDGRGLFLILDYPEERMDVVNGLVQAIRDRPDDGLPFPIRILLVSRRSFQDWQDVAFDLGPRFGRQELAHLGPLSPQQALDLFHQTRQTFISVSGTTAPAVQEDDALDWFARSEGNRAPLGVMAAALHQVLTGQGGFGLGAPELIAALADYELDRVRAVSQKSGLGRHGLPRLLALAALHPSGLTEDLCRALAAAGAAPLTGQDLIDALSETPWWQRRMDTQPPQIPRPEPDRMASVFLAKVLLDGASDSAVPTWFGLVADPQGDGFGDIISRVGYDLMEGRAEWRSGFERNLVAMLDQDPTRADRFSGIARREGTVFSAFFTVALLERLLKEPNLPDHNRAVMLNNLANRLSDLGRREEALQAAQEGTELCRLLSAVDPESFAPVVAMVLSTFASMLSDHGQREKALLVAEGAAKLYRLLSARNPETFIPNLAGLLSNLAFMLSELGRREEALQAAEEAVGLYRRLSAVHPEAFRSDLALVLNTLANSLSALGRREEALQTAQEAVELYRLLSAAHPQVFTPKLAGSLNNLANRLSEHGRREDALQAVQEAAGLYRRLSAAHPEAFTPVLAGSLNTLASMLLALGWREDALQAAQEAVAIRRGLSAVHPETFTPVLARSLNTLASMLSALGRREEALQAAQEAVEIRRRLSAVHPETFTPVLATSLNTLATMLSALGLREGALRAAQEAAELCRSLSAAHPLAFSSALAQALNTLANRLSEFGQREEALQASREAVELYRGLSVAHPDAFIPDLAMALNNIASMLLDLGRREEALQAAAEAAELYRSLSAAHPQVFAPDFAMALNTLATMLSVLGRREDALQAARDSVAIRRCLSAAHPQAFTPDLAVSLNNLAFMLSDLDLREEALQASREAMAFIFPFYLSSPATFARKAESIADVYQQACDAAGIAPEEDLLGPIINGLKALRGENGNG